MLSRFMLFKYIRCTGEKKISILPQKKALFMKHIKSYNSNK